MKKLLSILLCLSLLLCTLSLVACTGDDITNTLGGKTPEELYEISKQSLKEATSYHVNSVQDITMTSDSNDQTQTIKMQQTIESKINGDDSYIKTYNDMESTANAEAWYVDGVLYTSVAGLKVKKAISKSEYLEDYMQIDPSESTLLDIPESWFENIQFEKEGDSWVLNFNVSGEKYTEVFGNIGLTGASINGDVVYKMYFDKDGNIEKLFASFDFEMSGYTAHCESVSYIEIGEVQIDPPLDADSYLSF